MPDRDPIYDVAIVGYGPSGAVAAALLAQRGASVYACDRLTEVYEKPRAISLDHEILRLFQQMGVLAALEPFLEPFTDSVWQGVDAQPIRRMSTVPPPHPLAHPPSIVFTQPPVEGELRRHGRSVGVDVDLGAELIGLEQDAQGVSLRVRRSHPHTPVGPRGAPADEAGGIKTVRARWVIGCDGASSAVRTMCDISLDDLDFDENWLVADLLVGDEALARLPQTSAQYCRPERPVTYLICPGRHRRCEIAINPGEDPRQLATDAGTWALLSPWLKPGEATLWRQASYRFHALVASRWRVGRVFIAGDAAHQQPPFLGQGMCQGLRDVANLSWKLEAVLRGRASETLLDSYGLERRGHVVALTTRIKHIGQLIGERDPARARERDARLLSEAGGVVRPTPRQDVQPALAAGLLSMVAHPARGTIFPQAWLVQGAGAAKVRMDDVLGCGWRVVLAEGEPAPDPAGWGLPQIRVARLGDEGFTECDGVLAGWFARHRVCAAIVRPDHYVYGVATDAASLQSQLQRLDLG
ncbi:MAG: bifunctional 3-(3-hydroxy-phenyl)propionate/3-hydroxycinnamic acid hydroxylase [Betaproteobacteria bacterium]